MANNPNQNPNPNPGLNRRLPVARLAAYPANQQVQTAPQGAAERQHRLEALRRQLRYPHALADSTLRWHLNRTNWNVNLAARSFWEDQNNPNPNLNSQQRAPRNGVRQAVTVGRERRNMVHDRLVAERARTGALPMTYAEMALMHNDNQWGSDEVATDLVRRRGNYHDLRERVQGYRLPDLRTDMRDERLALLISITSTSSWYSARVLLERHRWDLAAAIDEWMRLGEVPAATVPKKRKRNGQHVPRYDDGGERVGDPDRPRRVLGTWFDFNTRPLPAMQASNFIDQAKSKPLSGRSKTKASVERTTAGPGSQRRVESQRAPGGTRIGVRRGHIIDEVRYEQAYVGVPDASKLRFEYIQRGLYHTRQYTGSFRIGTRNVAFRWDDTDDPRLASTTVEFDWYDASHVSKLNKWRADAFRSITAEDLRGHLVEFNKYEDAWLVEQEAMRNEEKFYEAANQDPAQQAVSDPAAYNRAATNWGPNRARAHFPVGMTQAELAQLTQAFNAQFAGRSAFVKRVERFGPDPDSFRIIRTDYVVKDLSAVGEVPRPARTDFAISQQRRRIKTLAKHFMLGGQAAQDDEDSDFDSDFD
ncbi:hypothetical protein A1O3_01145 [Capronia epimyces CBS 606.96]|uniref:Uncharacterized protein n=1 Tax=Capronia epimyces CBS 606.96 TaxID=1182542 RepID=W9YJ80_9EURO|nr:uncharacterized protein A1O3_01145 [Capronia epimyces CBS 606.96]EXJ92593.1 hypothetical protein A1O3_01145 [Capronia epimyces CBS 606.96]